MGAQGEDVGFTKGMDHDGPHGVISRKGRSGSLSFTVIGARP
jgi:hypothetical protein